MGDAKKVVKQVGRTFDTIVDSGKRVYKTLESGSKKALDILVNVSGAAGVVYAVDNATGSNLQKSFGLSKPTATNAVMYGADASRIRDSEAYTAGLESYYRALERSAPAYVARNRVKLQHAYDEAVKRQISRANQAKGVQQ